MSAPQEFKRLLRRVVVRLRHLLAPVRSTRARLQERFSAWLRRLPIPARLRSTLYRYVPWRPWLITVPLERLLLGPQNGLTARQFSEALGERMWASTPITASPHLELLRRGHRDHLSDEEILGSRYAEMARVIIRETGNFFDATDEAGLLAEARNFLARSLGEGELSRKPRVGETPRNSNVRAVRIAGSRCLQLVDGHHRAALLAFFGETSVKVRTSWVSTTTPLQDLLNRMSWIDGQRELYQPIDAPELADDWTTVRRCTDRMRKMEDFLKQANIAPEGGRYLDVACCYGWFVNEFDSLGFSASGVERDPLAPELAETVYGLDPEQIVVKDAVEFLSTNTQQYDVVTCLSLLHHFALGRATVTAAELVSLLDNSTRRVLFLDTGQSHEDWLRRTLPGWDTSDVVEFLRHETTFREVIDLGPDEDAVPPYEGNYGRHLFACLR